MVLSRAINTDVSDMCVKSPIHIRLSLELSCFPPSAQDTTWATHSPHLKELHPPERTKTNALRHLLIANITMCCCKRERERKSVYVCTCVCECILCKYVSVCQIIVHCATHVALLEELAIPSNSTNTQCHVILKKKRTIDQSHNIIRIILIHTYTQDDVIITSVHIYIYLYSKCFHSSTSHTSIMHAACSRIMEWDRGGEL